LESGFALDDVFEGWHGLLSPLLWGASEADASYDLRRAFSSYP